MISFPVCGTPLRVGLNATSVVAQSRKSVASVSIHQSAPECIYISALAVDIRVRCRSAAMTHVLAIEIVVRMPVKILLVAAADEMTTRHDAFLYVTFAATCNVTPVCTYYCQLVFVPFSQKS